MQEAHGNVSRVLCLVSGIKVPGTHCCTVGNRERSF